jgi:hypothetical protein
MDLHKTDGAFDKAWKRTCPKHNTVHMFFRECPDCVKDNKNANLIMVVTRAMRIRNLTSDDKIIQELDGIVDSVKEYIK